MSILVLWYMGAPAKAQSSGASWWIGSVLDYSVGGLFMSLCTKQRAPNLCDISKQALKESS